MNVLVMFGHLCFHINFRISYHVSWKTLYFGWNFIITIFMRSIVILWYWILLFTNMIFLSILWYLLIKLYNFLIKRFANLLCKIYSLGQLAARLVISCVPLLGLNFPKWKMWHLNRSSLTGFQAPDDKIKMLEIENFEYSKYK